MFDVQATRPVYARMNATINQSNRNFYLATGLLHTTAFMGLSYFFRYRRITTLPAIAIGTAYFYFFQNMNNVMYKIMVDQAVMSQARALGHSAQVQPVGQRKARGLNFV